MNCRHITRFLADFTGRDTGNEFQSFIRRSQGEFPALFRCAGEDADLLNQYNIPQYNNMFEKTRIKIFSVLWKRRIKKSEKHRRVKCMGKTERQGGRYRIYLVEDDVIIAKVLKNI